ncbi:MAG: class I SAM-dependent methyltransferase [Bacteroidia bacterium]|nr:class I SAM-dependent methyltransferase [Bacteroidia bacterium]
MNINLLNSSVEDFIKINLNTDIVSVLLKKSPFAQISTQELAQQLQGKQIAQKKFPTWFSTTGILYPKKIHLEQSSSEATSLYKSQLVNGKALLDMTGGYGVDTAAFAAKIEGVFYCEKNGELARITNHNFKQLGIKNISCNEGDGLDFLRVRKTTFDWIYLDPSRRSGTKKVIKLNSYEPNILELLEELFQSTTHILLKTSPLLDIHLGLEQLRFVSDIHVVALHNEVKELLWILNKNKDQKLAVTTVNIGVSQEQRFTYTLAEEQMATPVYGEPQNYLYEPNSAILKAGAFGLVGVRYGLKKLSKHSHLYTSDELIDFPGRSFQITGIAHFSNNWNKNKAIAKANITTRNFPLTVKEIRKKFKIKEGGDTYLFFTTLESGEKQVIECIKC